MGERMSLIHAALPRDSARLRRCLLLALSVASVSAVPASAQGWNFRPVFFVGAAYDSNVVFTQGGALSAGDYFGYVGLRAPLNRRLSEKTSLAASYSATCEWYQDLEGLDSCPSRQFASIRWSWVAGEKTTVGLGAGYSESRRPEEVFPESGIDYLRGTTRNASATANLSRRLGQQTTLGLTYGYGRQLYEPVEQLESPAQTHRAGANLSRPLWRQGTASLSYTYQLYVLEDKPDDSSHGVGLSLSQGLGKSTTLSVAAHARWVNGELRTRIRPQGDIRLGHSWRRSQISLSYSKYRSYELLTAGFTETDSIRVAYSITLRWFRLGADAGYSRNRLENPADPSELVGTVESYHGRLNLVRMVTRWLGAAATYRYTWQTDRGQLLEPRKRHLVHVGLVISPWSVEAEPLQ
jgi:hypothetical protein